MVTVTRPAGLAAAGLAAHAPLVVEADVARVVGLAEERTGRHHRPLEEVLAPEDEEDSRDVINDRCLSFALHIYSIPLIQLGTKYPQIKFCHIIGSSH